MIINRLKHNDTQNAGYRIIAAIEGKGEINGHPEFWVTMERTRWIPGNSQHKGKWVTEYVTWSGAWNPRDEDDKTTNWSLLYSQGHTEFYGEDARKDAIQDMMVRAGILAEPLAEWEKALLNGPIRLKEGIYTLNESDMAAYPTMAHVDHAGDIRMYYANQERTPEVWVIGEEKDILRKLLNGQAEPDKSDKPDKS